MSMPFLLLDHDPGLFAAVYIWAGRGQPYHTGMVQLYWPNMDQAVDIRIEIPGLFWVHLYLICEDQQLF